jgi:hypothetical protein
MKIKMEVIDAKTLDNYINGKTIPLAVCVTEKESLSKKQQIFLEKYYDRVRDKRGIDSYYCNVINAWKCKDMGYESIEFPNGENKQIKAYNLEKHPSIGNKYVVTPYFSKTDKINAIELIKTVRLEVEKVKVPVKVVTLR